MPRAALLMTLLLLATPAVGQDESWGPPQRGVRTQLSLSNAKARQGDTLDVTLRFQRHKDTTDDAITRFPEPSYRLERRARLRLRRGGEDKIWEIPFRGLGGPPDELTVGTVPLDGPLPEMTRKLALVPMGSELELPPGVYAVWAELDLAGLRPRGSRSEGELYRERLATQEIIVTVGAAKTEKAPVRLATWMMLGPETEDALIEYISGGLDTVMLPLRPGLQITAEWSLRILREDGSLTSKSTTFSGPEEGEPLTVVPRDSDALDDSLQRWIRLDVVQRGRGSARPHENAGTLPLETRWYRFGGDVPQRAPTEAEQNEIIVAWHLASWAHTQSAPGDSPGVEDELTAMDTAIRDRTPLHGHRLRDLPKTAGHRLLRVAEPVTKGGGRGRTLVADDVGRIWVARLGPEPVREPLDLSAAPWKPLH